MRATAQVSRRNALLVVVALIALLVAAELTVLRPAEGTAAAAPAYPTRCGSGRSLRVLMVGNSYTAANDLPGMLATLLCHAGVKRHIRVTADDPDGTTLADHRLSEDQLDHAQVLVLQDQSETPGLGSAATLRSQAAVGELADLAPGARFVLFATWGRQHGDPSFPTLYPDFDQMQRRLDEGYRSYLDAARAEASAQLAAVGDTWSWVRRHDPALFAQLYSSDGSHPSVAGTYLAALVLARSIIGRPLPRHPWRPSGIPWERAALLAVAARSS